MRPPLQAQLATLCCRLMHDVAMGRNLRMVRWFLSLHSGVVTGSVCLFGCLVRSSSFSECPQCDFRGSLDDRHMIVSMMNDARWLFSMRLVTKCKLLYILEFYTEPVIPTTPEVSLYFLNFMKLITSSLGVIEILQNWRPLFKKKLHAADYLHFLFFLKNHLIHFDETL